MAFLRLNDIITAIYDILRQDVRTLGIKWEKHKLVAATEQRERAGAVYYEGALPSVTPETMPGGDLGQFRVNVEVLVGAHEGMERTEELAREIIDDVLAVLVDTTRANERAWSIGLSYAYPVRVDVVTTLQPEATPPRAIVLFLVHLEVRPI